MNGEVNCILQVCCPAAEQQKALARWMKKKWDLTPEAAKQYSADLLEAVDLGPKGFVTPLLRKTVEIYTAPPHKEDV